MGWRDRDWAKFTDDEFAAIYGSPSRSPYVSGAGPARVRGRGRGWGRADGHRPRFPLLGAAFRIVATAVIATGAIFAGLLLTGNVDKQRSAGAVPHFVPGGIPIVPTIAVHAPRPSHRVGLINGSRILGFGGTFTLSGTHSPQPGSIIARGRWNSGGWFTLGVASASRRSYSMKIPLTRRGVLHLEVSYPDGSSAVGTYRVV